MHMTSVKGNEKKAEDSLNNGKRGEKEIEEPKRDNCENNLIQTAHEKIQEKEEIQVDQEST